MLRGVNPAPVFAALSGLIVGCAPSTPAINETPPAPPIDLVEPLIVEVTGGDYQWNVRYPGRDRVLDTDDDLLTRHDIRLPVSTTVMLELRSDDLIYTFSIPDKQLSQVAIPDLEFSLEYRSDATGEFEYKGDQMCGYTHPLLIGKIIVLPRDEFVAWMHDSRANGVSEPSTPRVSFRPSED